MLAHPHIFIDTGVEVLLDDQNRATAVRISWTYDDLTSLALIADRGLDEDFDGVLTPEETAAITGFDMDWEPGFAGDSYALLGEVPLDWSGPQGDGLLCGCQAHLVPPAPLLPSRWFWATCR